MRPISWLHISDIHVRPPDAWSQRVVMRAMCEHIAAHRTERPPDFILVTGDLAFAGKPDEYALVGAFLDDLVQASGVPKTCIYCIPGNHDVDRDRQRFCFQGARAVLQDQSAADSFLGSPADEDFATLLAREAGFRGFQERYFEDQERTPTADGLGYVARLTFDGVRLAIIGLDSAWLAQGGIEDHTRLLIGERQVINAMDIAYNPDDPPDVVVAMAHHPLHLLQDFDRRPIQTRIERQCHFFHCGHLHEPEQRAAGQSTAGCLILAAGASFETRHSHNNTYGLVTLDLLRAERSVTTWRYSPAAGAFEAVATATYRMDVLPSADCPLADLAAAVSDHTGTPWPAYFAALLLGKKAEIPVPAGGGHVMASLAVIEAETASTLRELTLGFFTFRNALNVLYGREPLEGILREHGGVIARYSATLVERCTQDPELRAKLDTQEDEAQRFVATQTGTGFTHTARLLNDLAAAHEWDVLKAQAERHIDSSDPALARQARRMLALALAHSEDGADRARARDLYRTLSDDQSPEPTDIANFVTLLTDSDREEAKSVLLNGIARCAPSAAAYFGEIGHRIVAATGDREFRNTLEAAIAARGQQ